jgi:hypothetical protein
MTRNGPQDLTRLFGGKRSIPVQQSGSMRERNIERSNGFRETIQWNIPGRYHFYLFIKCRLRRIVKSAAAPCPLALGSSPHL